MGLGKKRPTSSGRHLSETIDGKSFHLETHQRIFHSSLLYTVYRQSVQPQNKFSTEEALQLIDKNHRKKQALCLACLLEDRMTLEKTAHGKEPFRTWVAYKEIVDMRFHPKRKDMFVLMINSKTSNARYYEVYRCTPKENIKHYERILRKGMEDPEGLARVEEVEGIKEINESTDRPRTLTNFEFQNSIDDDQDATDESDSQILSTNVIGKTKASPNVPAKVNQNNVHASPPSPVELITKQTSTASIDAQPIVAPVPRKRTELSYAYQQKTLPISQQRTSAVAEYTVQIQNQQKQFSSPSPKTNYWPTSPALRRRRTIEKLDHVTFVNYGYAGYRCNNGRGPVYLYVYSERHVDETGGLNSSSTGHLNGHTGLEDDENDHNYEYERYSRHF